MSERIKQAEKYFASSQEHLSVIDDYAVHACLNDLSLAVGWILQELSVNQIKKEKASSKCVSIWKPHTSISQEEKAKT